ncbi:MAG: LemA family protein [Acidobacteriota bacterium]
MKVLVVLLALAAVVLGLVFWGVGVNNNLTRMDESINGAWSEVQNNYQRRSDLIPNLVETVKGAANFEQGTFTAVTEARAKAGQVTLTPESLKDPQAFARFEQAQGELGSALSRLLVTVENYPDLKASQNFRDLQAQLEGTENRITVARQRFNQAVQSYNSSVRVFPASVIASFRNFAARPYFQAKEGADQAPAVKF